MAGVQCGELRGTQRNAAFCQRLSCKVAPGELESSHVKEATHGRDCHGGWVIHCLKMLVDGAQPRATGVGVRRSLRVGRVRCTRVLLSLGQQFEGGWKDIGVGALDHRYSTHGCKGRHWSHQGSSCPMVGRGPFRVLESLLGWVGCYIGKFSGQGYDPFRNFKGDLNIQGVGVVMTGVVLGHKEP
eukprot:139661-Hanusia_phi.AAC.3